MKLLYNSYVHDAKLENIEYDCAEDKITVQMLNPIFNTKMNLTLCNIEMVFSVKGDWHGDRETIHSLTLEKDFSYLNNYLLKQRKPSQDSLYLLFQMFSGDEIHIICKEVIIDDRWPVFNTENGYE